jgi:2-keto-4-pentenoate hydratase/2-oxohepta-3-ene-1,7-dioic acid hydratase in catechol pathway
MNEGVREGMMKFARFEHKGNVFLGTLKGEEITLLDGSPFDRYEETETIYPLSEVKLLPPVIPTKIVCIGLNYREHIEEIGASIPEEPSIFLKPPSSLVGHEDVIIYPPRAERVDYEGELAVVIREELKGVPEDAILQYVLGFSCFNDVTERALVMKDQRFLTIAKGFDTFSSLGPYVVTGLDPNNLTVKTYMNGKLMQDDNTRNCIFSVQQILHYISQCMTLYPGDIVTTGTPRGVAPMKPGDVVEVEVEGVGRLRNTVRAAESEGKEVIF